MPEISQAMTHNHDKCIHIALTRAESICQANQTQLTPVRKKVLELIWASHRPVLAYDLIHELSKIKKNTTPPTVYRSLHFLLEQGLIHKIESQNSYVGCGMSDAQHTAQFLICEMCKSVTEVDFNQSVNQFKLSAEKIGFNISSSTLEFMGTCRDCRKSS